MTDQNSKTTTYAYDDEDRLTSATDAGSNVTTYAYDTENNLSSITDANSHETTFTYDAYGRVTETTFPSGHSENYYYDANNNLTSKTDRNSQTINYIYDALNRLTEKDYPDSTNVEYVYDLVGKITGITDPTGTYGFSYDNMGRLTGTTTQYSFLSGTTFTNAYTYDAASNRTGFTAPDSSTNTYTYDTLNQLAGLSNSWAGSFGFSYDALSRRTQMTRPNSIATNYSYDNLSRLLSVLHQSGGSTIDGAAYTLDSAGNRTVKVDDLASVTSDYTYDAIYELTLMTQGGTTKESYSYDAMGNRTASLGVSSYTTNSSNELTTTSSTSYAYDYNGNTTSKTDSGGTTDYTWDYENRLASVTLPSSGGTVTFKYDALGHRVQKAFTHSSTTSTTNYLYDDENLIEELDQTGTIVARYTQTENTDEPLAEIRSGVTSYYEADGLGSVTSLSNSSSSLAATYAYDSFGRSTGSTGSLTNPVRYAGREFDTETGLYYNRARYYDPAAGRFLSEDPIGFESGDVNFYSYVSNSPVAFLDPFGFQEGSPANLVRRQGIAKGALGYKSSHAFDFHNYFSPQYPSNSWKCSGFVCAVLAQTGVPIVVTPKGGKPRCPTAGELANTHWNPKNWRQLAHGETPQPGDVGAYPLNGSADPNPYTGHSGIFTDQGAMAAHDGGDAPSGVYVVPDQFAPTVPGIVYRRYIGD